MHVHSCIVSRNATRQTLPTSAKLTYLSVYDSRDGVSERTASPSTPSSLMHVHRCIGSRNATRQTLPTSAKLTYLSVYDSRDGVSEHTASPSHPSSLTHVYVRRVDSSSLVFASFITPILIYKSCLYLSLQ
jgi:hypothetical protein